MKTKQIMIARALTLMSLVAVLAAAAPARAGDDDACRCPRDRKGWLVGFNTGWRSGIPTTTAAPYRSARPPWPAADCRCGWAAASRWSGRPRPCSSTSSRCTTTPMAPRTPTGASRPRASAGGPVSG